MKRLMITLVAVAVLPLAACGGSAGDPASVSVQELGDSGRVLVNSAGKAL